MKTKEIITKELHFDSPTECKDYMETMISKGYKVICHGAEDDWYFICRKEREVC